MKSDLPIWPHDAVPVPIGPARYHSVMAIQAGITISRTRDGQVMLVMGDDEAVELAKIILKAYEGDAYE